MYRIWEWTLERKTMSKLVWQNLSDSLQKIVQQSGCPVEVQETQIKAITDSYRHSTTREIEDKLNVSHKYIEK